jgi:hypothetical protein
LSPTNVKICVFFLRIQKPFAQFDMLYDKPWTRVGPYLVGMATGWLLCRTKCTLKMSPVSFQPLEETDSQSESKTKTPPLIQGHITSEVALILK